MDSTKKDLKNYIKILEEENKSLKEKLRYKAALSDLEKALEELKGQDKQYERDMDELERLRKQTNHAMQMAIYELGGDNEEPTVTLHYVRYRLPLPYQKHPMIVIAAANNTPLGLESVEYRVKMLNKYLNPSMHCSIIVNFDQPKGSMSDTITIGGIAFKRIYSEPCSYIKGRESSYYSNHFQSDI